MDCEETKTAYPLELKEKLSLKTNKKIQHYSEIIALPLNNSVIV